MQKISFHTTSWTVSKMILGDTGSEKLEAPGEMIVKFFGDTERCRSVYMNEDFIERTFTEANPVNNNADNCPSFSIPPIEDSYEEGIFGESNQSDELLAEAAKVVLDSGIATISIIQKNLRIGYARSARLLDFLEEKGVVSEFDGSRPRKILMTRKQVASLFPNDSSCDEKTEPQQQTTQENTSVAELPEEKCHPKSKRKKNVIENIIAWFKGED